MMGTQNFQLYTTPQTYVSVCRSMTAAAEQPRPFGTIALDHAFGFLHCFEQHCCTSTDEQLLVSQPFWVHVSCICQPVQLSSCSCELPRYHENLCMPNCERNAVSAAALPLACNSTACTSPCFELTLCFCTLAESAFSIHLLKAIDSSCIPSAFFGLRPAHLSLESMPAPTRRWNCAQCA